MPERDHADACGLRHTPEVRDRDARHTVNRVDAVELECINDEMKAIRQILLCFQAVVVSFFFSFTAASAMGILLFFCSI